MVEKSGYHHGDLRQALIDAAIALIAERDANSLSLREVARRVGVSHAAPYRHFQDKEDLLVAVAEEGFAGLTAAMLRGIDQAPDDPLERLAATGIAYVQFAIAHPSHYRVMFGNFPLAKLAPAEASNANINAFGVLLKQIQLGQETGVVRPGDITQLGLVAWSLVHGLAMLLIDRQLPFTQPDEINALAIFVTHTLIEGLGV